MALPTQEALTFTGPPLAGSDGLTEILNKMKSLVAHRSGTSRPADIQQNELWCDTTTATAQALKIYDGAQDITIGTFNSTTHTWTVAGALLLSLFTAANDFIIASGSGTAVKKTLAEIKTLLAGTSAGDLMAYDANIVFDDAVHTYTAQQLPTSIALTSSSGTTAFNNATCLESHGTLTESTTLGDPANKAAEQAGRIIITGASTYTLAVHTNWKMADGTAVALTPAAGKKTWIDWECNGTYNYITKIIQEA